MSSRNFPAALNGDSGAALRSAGINDGSSTGRFHSNQKAVGLFAPSDRGLIRAFHDNSLLKEVVNGRGCARHPTELHIIFCFHVFGQACSDHPCNRTTRFDWIRATHGLLLIGT